jgi:6-phosphogluconolactonase
MTGEPLVTMVADEDEAAERAAEVLATALDAARTVHGVAHASLAGGSTPLRAYELLGERLPDWSDVHFWFGDERCVPPDDEESNYRMVHERLVVPGSEIHRCRGEMGPDAAAAEYADALRDVVLDVALLGMGPDGHTASLFPGNEALRAEGIAFGVRSAPKPPPERVTLTLPYLNSARRIVLLTTGEAKAPALARVVAGPDEATPASLLARDRLEIVADEAALSGSAVRG